MSTVFCTILIIFSKLSVYLHKIHSVVELFCDYSGMRIAQGLAPAVGTAFGRTIIMQSTWLWGLHCRISSDVLLDCLLELFHCFHIPILDGMADAVRQMLVDDVLAQSV